MVMNTILILEKLCLKSLEVSFSQLLFPLKDFKKRKQLFLMFSFEVLRMKSVRGWREVIPSRMPDV